MPIWQAFVSVSQKYSNSEYSVPAGGYLLLKVLPPLDMDILYINLFPTDFIIPNNSEAISDLRDIARTSIVTRRELTGDAARTVMFAAGCPYWFGVC